MAAELILAPEVEQDLAEAYFYFVRHVTLPIVILKEP
jgi:hypothetical protein